MFYCLHKFGLLLSTTGKTVESSKQNKKDGDDTKFVTTAVSTSELFIRKLRII